MSSAGGSHLVYEFYKIVVVVAFLILSVPAVGKKKKTCARGLGDLSILLEAVNIIP